MNEFLLNIDWSLKFENKSFDECYDEFLHVYRNVCEVFIPTKTIDNRKSDTPKWIISEIKILIREKLKLWHYNNRTKWKNTEMAAKFRDLKIKIKKEIRIAVSNSEFELAKKAKKDPKLIYSYMNSKREIKDDIRALQNKEGVITENKTEIVNLLNNQFKSVFVEDNRVFPRLDPINARHIFEWDVSNEVTTETVLTKLKELNENKACGNDGVKAIVLKRAAEGFALPLMYLFRSSLIESKISGDWRDANISPIFKSGSKLESSNYRPISLTSVVCKLIESIVRDKMLQIFF